MLLSLFYQSLSLVFGTIEAGLDVEWVALELSYYHGRFKITKV